MAESAIHLLMCSAKSGVRKSQIFDAVRTAHAVLRRLPGFVEHEVACAAFDGQWIDIVHWSDPDAASGAEARFRLQPETRTIAAVLELQWIEVMQLRVPAIEFSGISARS
jgi:hypothetical protein